MVIWKNVFVKIILISVLLSSFAGCVQQRVPVLEELRLATTTSACDTGLLEVLNKKFEEMNNIKITTTCEGTGKALETGEHGEADVVMVHSIPDELKAVANGSFIDRRTLSDRGTYLAIKDKIKLRILFEKDQIFLFNPYHVMAVNPAKFPTVKYDLAVKYIDYVTSSKVQYIIRNYGKDRYGEALFVPAANVLEKSREH